MWTKRGVAQTLILCYLPHVAVMDSKIEERFARSLASNDTRTRARALKRLTQWVAARSSLEDGFSELEFLKLWKGLYMCMWHSDKPLVQEELAERLAGLVTVMRRWDVALQYLRTFFLTIAREWHSIDRLRLDKFYLLIRKMVRESFKLLQSLHWDHQAVQELVGIVEAGPLSADLSKTTLGVQLHVLEVYVSELASCSPVERSLDLLSPCLSLLAHTRDVTVCQCVCDSVLGVLDEECMEKLQLSSRALSDRLRGLAIDRSTVGRNRKIIYSLCRKFSDVDSVSTQAPLGSGLVPKKAKLKKKHKKRKRRN